MKKKSFAFQVIDGSGRSYIKNKVDKLFSFGLEEAKGISSSIHMASAWMNAFSFTLITDSLKLK